MSVNGRKYNDYCLSLLVMREFEDLDLRVE